MTEPKVNRKSEPGIEESTETSLSAGGQDRMKKRGPPVRDLRDLAAKIVRITEGHFCYAQAWQAVSVLVDYLCAMARIEEMNHAAAGTQQASAAGRGKPAARDRRGMMAKKTSAAICRRPAT